MGLAVGIVGFVIVGVALFAGEQGFHAPRWVVACVGGAFLFFGGWIAAIYATGFDPARPDETLPPPLVQLAVLLPGLLCFAAPFHWIAFWPGPRQFSTSFSLPFLSVRGSSSGLSGRIAFGAGAVLIDALVVASAVRLLRRARASGARSAAN